MTSGENDSELNAFSNQMFFMGLTDCITFESSFFVPEARN